MSKLRLVVIGAGSWVAASHLPELDRRSDVVERWGVCRHGAEALERIRSTWGFTHASEDYTEVLRDGADIAVIASPTAFHHEHALAAMEAGAHVLVEKPFTSTTEQANELVTRAGELGRHLVVSYGYNYRPIVRGARARLRDEHGIGTVEHVAIHMASGTRELLAGIGAYARASESTAPETDTWTDPALSGGGYGQAQLTHALALASWLQPFHVDAVTAVAASPLGGRVEQHAAAILELEGGGVGTLSGASGHQEAMGRRDQLQVRMVGSDGQFQLEMENDLCRLYRPDVGDILLEFEDGSGRYECDGPPNVLVDLALGIPTENCSPGWLGASTVSILEAMYRSLETGRRQPTEQSVPAEDGG